MKKSNRPRNRTALRSIEQDILGQLTAGDMLMSFLLSARSTRAYYREASKRARARYLYKRSLEGLQARGLVTLREDTIGLTKKGKELMEIIASRPREQQRWNSRWWIVIYDIPVSMNPYRFELRRILAQSGFRKLQHSVWISPQPCHELEIFLHNNPEVSNFVRCIETLPFANMKTVADWKKLSRSG